MEHTLLLAWLDALPAVVGALGEGDGCAWFEPRRVVRMDVRAADVVGASFSCLSLNCSVSSST